MALDDGERRAQLVGGIVEELLLLAERALHPVEHVVERGDEAADLIGGTLIVDAAGRVLAREPRAVSVIASTGRKARPRRNQVPSGGADESRKAQSAEEVARTAAGAR